MNKMIEKNIYKWTLLWMLCLTTPLTWGQDRHTTGPEITGDNENDWYTQPWVWIIGAVLLIILITALLRSTKTSRSIVDKSRIDTTESSPDTERDTTR